MHVRHHGPGRAGCLHAGRVRHYSWGAAEVTWESCSIADSALAGLGWDLGLCISNRYLSVTDAASPGLVLSPKTHPQGPTRCLLSLPVVAVGSFSHVEC